MEYNLKEINYANTIIFDGGDYFRVKIDKIEHKIYQLYSKKACEIEITKEIGEVAQKYTIGDIVINTPYNMAVFLNKVLNSQVNRKCTGWLKVWDSIVLE